MNTNTNQTIHFREAEVEALRAEVKRLSAANAALVAALREVSGSTKETHDA